MIESQLPRILREGAGKYYPVVFDFDNTVVCGDIGEATLATLINESVEKPLFARQSHSKKFGFFRFLVFFCPVYFFR